MHPQDEQRFFNNLLDNRVGEGAEDEEEANGTEDNGTEPVRPSYKKIETFDNPNYGSTTHSVNPKIDGFENGGFVPEKNGLKQDGMEINAGIDQTAYEAAIVPMQDVLGNDFISKSHIPFY